MKQLGANEASLRNLIETGITVDSVSEELFCVQQTEIGPSLQKALKDRSFNRCGVKEGDRIIGYFEPDTSIERQSIRIEQLVAETTPLWLAMPRLAESQWLFVLTSSGLTGIVTVADLAKQPSRLLMFGMVSLLEMTMLAIIRREYPNGEWRELISLERIDKAEDLLSQRRQKGQDIDLADCLQWCDKGTICQKTQKIMSEWSFSSNGECERFLNNVQDFRDQLAHSQHPAPDGNWWDVVCWLKQADNLIMKNMNLLNRQGEIA